MSSEKSSKKGKVDAIEDEELELDVNNDDSDEEDQEGSEEPNPHSDITLLLKELAEHPDEPYE